MRRHHRVSISLLIALTTVLVLSTGVSAASPAGEPVSDCTSINSSGEYHLTGNITAPANQTCIFINASDVVVDGNGHTIKGNGSGANAGHPIFVKNASDPAASPDGYLSNVTIRNVGVANWSQTVYFRQVDDAGVENTLIRDSFKIGGTSSGTGIRFLKGSNVRIVDSRVADTAGEGIVFREVSRTLIGETTVANTGEFGILIDGGSTHAVRNNTVVKASLVGIYTPTQGRTDDVLIENNTVRSSTRSGIRTWATRNSRIANNTITGNDGVGIWVSGSYSENVTLDGNTIRGNARGGILVKNVNEFGDGLVVDNTVRGNGGIGIAVNAAENTSVRDNRVDDNDDDGLKIQSSRNVTVAGNVLTNHTASNRYGIRLRNDFDGLRVTDNVVCSNVRGLFVRKYSSGVATLEGNRIASNTKDGVLIDYNTPVETISFQHNVIADNGNYGIYSRNEQGAIRATDNWWGSTDGPSSPGSTTLEDPVTGALADGAGDNVSENGSDPGVSNVHFDPSLSSKPSSVAANCPGVNEPPSVSADNDTVTAEEGDTATNTGTFADPEGDAVTLNASVGTVTKNADGTWDWSFTTTDGPDQSQTVTVTATDDDGDSGRTTFTLTVENRPPFVSADNGSVTVSGGETATNTGTFGDPGNDTVALNASAGTVTKSADGTWDWSYDTAGTSAGNLTVTITATDDDGASAEATFTLTVEGGLEPGEDYTADFKGCSEVWIALNEAGQLPVEATIQVYNASSDTTESVAVRIGPDDVERVPGQYDDRPLYKFNVHDYFGAEDGDDKVLAVSVGGGPVAENPNQCADRTGDDSGSEPDGDSDDREEDDRNDNDNDDNGEESERKEDEDDDGENGNDDGSPRKEGGGNDGKQDDDDSNGNEKEGNGNNGNGK